METFKNKKRNKGSASGDLILVASTVLLLGVLWVASGGPSQYGNIENMQSISLKGGIISRIDNFFIPIERSGSSSGQNEEDEKYDKIFEEYGRVRDFGETSKYWGLISIDNSSSGPRQTLPQDEYVELRASDKLGGQVVITGWKLQSMISNEVVTIGEAVKVSTSGNVNIEQPISVSAKDKVYILTGHSPIGDSFQINKCSGYFEQFQKFTPNISKQCPTPESELIFAESDPLRFGEECLSYIEDLPRCYMPLEALPIEFSNSCVIFITEEINYSKCVKNHRNDADFFKPEWRVYLKHNQEIWNKRDIIRLLDDTGKVVDVFSY